MDLGKLDLTTIPGIPGNSKAVPKLEYEIKWQTTESPDLIEISATVERPASANEKSNLPRIKEKPNSEGRIQHLSQVGECFRSLSANDHLTDVVISIDDHMFNAHKAVLITHSEYFKNVLLNTKSDAFAEIRVTGIPVPAFNSVLEFMYSSELELTTRTIGDIHTAAEKLQISCLLEVCESKLSTYNAHDALVILKNCSNKESLIFNRAFQLVVKHFPDVCNAMDLAELNADTFMTILVSDDLVARTEMNVFLAAIDWIQYDENRLKVSSRILGAIRYCYMTPKELLKCSDLIEGMKAEIQPLMKNAMWYSVTQADRRECYMPITLPSERKYGIPDQ